MAVLNGVPIAPGANTQTQASSTGEGTFLSYWVEGDASQIASFSATSLPELDWTIESPPQLVTSIKGQQKIASYTKGTYLLTIYVDENPSKGGARGNVYVILRLQDK